jgi:hypothetical protein
VLALCSQKGLGVGAGCGILSRRPMVTGLVPTSQSGLETELGLAGQARWSEELPEKRRGPGSPPGHAGPCGCILLWPGRAGSL